MWSSFATKQPTKAVDIGLKSQGCRALAFAFRDSASLEELNISNRSREWKNEISDEVASLVDSLPQSIRELDMQGMVHSHTKGFR